MIIARAPVRISFGGGGTDLDAYYEQWDGFVLSTAITRYCYVVVREARDKGIHIYSADYHCAAHYEAGEPLTVIEPLRLPKAVLAWFTGQGLLASGVDLVLAADVPPGTGLGSSSAMTVALIHALARCCDMELDKERLARIACMIEIDHLGMPIGKQDQYASAYGGLNTLTFTGNGVAVQPVDLGPSVAAALNARLLLFSTGQARHSASILRDQRRDSSSKPVVIGTLHRLKALAGEMSLALQEGRLDTFGRLLDAGWQEKRSLSAAVSSGAIDGWYDAARDAGALGGKITGAGGGGFLLLYCPLETQAAVRQRMARCGLQELSFDFDVMGTQVFDRAPACQVTSVLSG